MPAITSTFQQGDANNYAGTLDTYLFQGQPDTTLGNASAMVVGDGASNAAHALLRFDSFIGNTATQVPAGSRIIRATLTLDTQISGDGAELHRMLADWAPSTDTWNAFGNSNPPRNGNGGVQANGQEALAGFAAQIGNSAGIDDPAVGQTVIEVTEDVQAWVDGTTTNRGWALLPFTNGTTAWQVSTSEHATVANRPKLTVTWEPPHLSATSFRQGVNSYTGALDTMLQQAAPSTNNAATVNLFVSAATASDEQQVLIRFNNIVGNGAGQVPEDSIIIAAYLDLAHVSLASPGHGGTLHRMLSNWTDTATWNSLTGGVQANGVEARAAFNAQIGNAGLSPIVHSGFATYDVTADVAAWVQDPVTTPNRGWALLPWPGGTDTLGFSSSESSVVNERPRLRIVFNGPARVTLPSANFTYNENDPPTLIDASATVVDTDSPDLDTGFLRVDFSANGSADDRLAIRNQGTGTGQIGLSGNDVLYENVKFGTFSGGVGTDPLVISFNANATGVKAQALLRNITFENISDNPSQATRTVRAVVFDGDSTLSQPATKQIFIKSIAETPSFTNTTTPEDVQSTTGLVITPDPRDGDSVVAFKITQIQNGRLFKNNGTTEIVNNEYITTAEATAGLKFTPDLNLNSVNSAFTFKAQANVGGGDSGLGGSIITLTITVLQVNDEPVFTLTQSTVTVNEDVGFFSLPGLATGMGRGGGSDEGSQTLVFQLVADDPSLFLIQPSIDAAGRLTFSTETNANGSTLVTVNLVDSGGTANGGDDTATQTITVTINPIADGPIISPATTNEDIQSSSGLVIDRTPGDGDEVSHFKITNIVNGRLFLNNGVTEIFNNRFLTYAEANAGLKFTPAANLNDTTTGAFAFDVQSAVGSTDADLGGPIETAFVSVLPVNDEPTFVLAQSSVTVNEDSGPFTRINFLTNRRPGPVTATDEAGQTMTLNFGNDNNALFSAQPTINAAGTLTFTPAANAFGTATVTVNLVDNGGTANGGDNTGTQTFLITVSNVNDQPSFDLLGDVTVTEDAGPQTRTNFAFNFNPGPGEGSQTVDNYSMTLVSSTGNLTFSAGPAIDPSGTLTFTPADNAFGSATYEVVVTDSGGPPPSAPKTVTINVTNVDDPAAAADDSYSIVTASDPVDLLVLTNDLPLNDGPSLSIVGVSVGSGGGTIVNLGDRISYTPAPGFLGDETFTYTVSDGSSTATANVTVTVRPAAPDASIIALGTDAGVVARVRLLDPATRAVLREFAPFDGYTGGVHVALGDLTGDGVVDTAVTTATGVAHVKVFDGVTGGVVWSFLPFGGFGFGLEVGAGDINADGIADLVIATTNGSTHVRAFAGGSQADLLSFFAFAGFGGGVRLAVGYANGDANADIAVVAGPGGNGHVKVFDGATGAIQRSYFAYFGYNGEVFLSIGRINGDRMGDIVTTAVNPSAGIHVISTSGATGGYLQSFFAPLAVPQPGLIRPPFTTIPAGRISLADITGDNIDDMLLVMGPSTLPTQLEILDGRSLAIVDLLFAFGPAHTFGAFVDAG